MFKKTFIVLFAGQWISLLGSALAQFALIWWLTTETGSATVLAVASLFGLMPQVVLRPFIGTLVDRLSHQRVMVVADSVVAAASLVLAGLFAAGVAQPWHVMALTFVRALGGAFQEPALFAATSLMVPKSQLARAHGIHQALVGGAGVLAAPFGALLLKTVPMQGILAIDVGTALFAIVPMALATLPRPPVVPGEASYWQDLGAGFGYLRARTGLLLLVGVTAAINFFVAPAFTLLPLLVTSHLGGGPLQLAWLILAFGLGTVAGGITLGTWGGFRRRIHTAIVGLVLLGLAIVAVAAVPAGLMRWAIAAVFAVGFCVPLVNGSITAAIQAVVDASFQGRVLSLLGSASEAMAPVGLLLAGPLADAVGVRALFLASGVVCSAMGVAAYFVPAIVTVEDAPVTPASSAAGEKRADDDSSVGSVTRLM